MPWRIGMPPQGDPVTPKLLCVMHWLTSIAPFHLAAVRDRGPPTSSHVGQPPAYLLGVQGVVLLPVVSRHGRHCRGSERVGRLDCCGTAYPYKMNDSNHTAIVGGTGGGKVSLAVGVSISVFIGGPS